MRTSDIQSTNVLSNRPLSQDQDHDLGEVQPKSQRGDVELEQEQSQEQHNEPRLEQYSMLASPSMVHIMHPQVPAYDTRIIHPRFYNRFSMRQFPMSLQKTKLAIGVTSAGRKEGKTMVAANLAVSLSHGYRHKTAIIDLSTSNPELHRIFHVNQGPGISEAFRNDHLELSATAFPELFVLPVGFDLTREDSFQNVIWVTELIDSLKRYFDFIIIDMNSVFPSEQFPLMLAGELDGILSVVDASKTSKHAVRRLNRQLKGAARMGFVLNRIKENE